MRSLHCAEKTNIPAVTLGHVRLTIFVLYFLFFPLCSIKFYSHLFLSYNVSVCAVMNTGTIQVLIIGS